MRPDSGGHGAAYRLAGDDALRALPTSDGGTRSAFGPDGIVPGTERAERLLFWPMGIDNPGAMRQMKSKCEWQPLGAHLYFLCANTEVDGKQLDKLKRIHGMRTA